MDEDWRLIPVFPKYRVSNLGRVQSVKSGRFLKPSKNQQGHLKVNLLLDGVAYTRNVNHLVARAFIDHATRPDFISLIHLDGDKENCEARNLMWRPRYFAIRYHMQFHHHLFQEVTQPIVDIKSGEVYDNIQAAVVTHGLLFNDIIRAMHARTFVWPTFQEFRVLAD